MITLFFAGIQKLSRIERGNGLIRKMVRLVKFIIIGIALVVKMFLVLKYIHALIKLKYLAIATGYLILNGVKLWLYAKQQKEASKVVHYEYSTHDNILEDAEDDWIGESWKRKVALGKQDVIDVPYTRHEISYPFLKQQRKFLN